MTIRRIAYWNRNLFTKLLSLFTILLPAYWLKVLQNDLILVYGGNLIGWEFLLLFGRFFGKKVVFRSTLFGFDDAASLAQDHLLGKFRKLALQSVDIYLAINKDFAHSWENVLGDDRKILVHPQGVDIFLFSPLVPHEKSKIRKALDLPEDRFLILSVGYLIHRKGYVSVFRALSRLPFPFLYVIVGDLSLPTGHHLSPLEQETMELRKMGNELLQEKILFAGPSVHPENYYRAADLFILFSIQEGFPPNSVLEALACGLPVITRDIDGSVTGTVLDEVIIREKDESGLQRAVTRIYEDSGLRMSLSEKARQSILATASYESLWNGIKNRLK